MYQTATANTEKKFFAMNSRIRRLEAEEKRIERVLGSTGLHDQMRRTAVALLEATQSELKRLRKERNF